MLDEVWLQELQFDSIWGRVTGLAGIGSEKVVFNLTTPIGEESVLRLWYPQLAFAIRELPPDLTLQREYDVERINRKLLRLVGNPLLDAITWSYNDLYVSLVEALYKQGVADLLQGIDSKLKESTIFLLHTPGMKRRLQDMASLTGEGRGRRRMIEATKGVYDYRSRIVQRARKNLRDIELLPRMSPEARPEKLSENPLYTWGAAIMDGFFTDEELPRAAAFLTERFGPLPQHPQAKTFTKQIVYLVYLLERAGPNHVFRFIQLCNMVGLLPEGADVLELPGEVYLERGQHQEALAIFNKALALDDQDVRVLTFRGDTYRQMGRYQEALTDLNRAIALDPQNVEAIIYRGETYVNMGCFEEALTDFDEAITLDPQNIEAFANRGIQYRQMRRYQEALDDFNRALSLLNGQNSDLKLNPDLILGRAITYLQLGRSQEALDDLNQVIVLSSVINVVAHVNRALIFAQDGQYMKALDDLNSAISATFSNDRNAARIFTTRGRIYVELERYEEALADFDYALTINEQDIETIISRGETYRIMERYQEALTDLDRAILLDPQNFEAFVNRGETYRVMGRYKEALADFEHALTLDPQNAEIITRRDIVRHQMEHEEEERSGKKKGDKFTR